SRDLHHKPGTAGTWEHEAAILHQHRSRWICSRATSILDMEFTRSNWDVRPISGRFSHRRDPTFSRLRPSLGPQCRHRRHYRPGGGPA
ncbi:MAG: hypothetical protein M1835_003782, partial [Candelina submexicana]